jgi:DNA polymerase-3 subunit epsilon
MREIVLDTETTGLDPSQGHRLVELGCIELINRIPTGSTFHVYLNPERDVPAEAAAIHGLTTEFLRDKPLFADVADDFLAFIGDDAPLVIHNASFDHGFLCAELKRVARALIARERLIDTLMLARRKHPAGPNRLDDLCARYGIDNSRRTKHGALLDAEILAEVYVELIGARQAQLGLAELGGRAVSGDGAARLRARPVALTPRISEEERAAHREFIASLGEDAVWRGYLPRGTQ